MRNSVTVKTYCIRFQFPTFRCVILWQKAQEFQVIFLTKVFLIVTHLLSQILKQKQRHILVISDCNGDVQIKLHEVNIANTNSSSEKSCDWIQVLVRGGDQDNSPTVFSPVSPSGPVDCVPEDFLPREYFLNMFGKNFVDLLVQETNTYGNNKVQAKGTIPKSSHFHKWYHTNREELLVFLAVNMAVNSCKYGID